MMQEDERRGIQVGDARRPSTPIFISREVIYGCVHQPMMMLIVILLFEIDIFTLEPATFTPSNYLRMFMDG